VIEGIRTDVHEIGIASFAAVCEDASRHRPIRGGISISNGMEFILGGGLVISILLPWSYWRKKGFSRCNTMGLTNWHALYVGSPTLV